MPPEFWMFVGAVVEGVVLLTLWKPWRHQGDSCPPEKAEEQR